MSARHRFLVIAALLPVLHAASALELPSVTGARLVVPVASIKQLRFQSTLRQQYDFSCGSAALATLLTYHYGIAVSEQAVFEQMFRHGDQRTIRSQGFSMLDMQRYLAARGFRADGFELPLQKLIDSKLPAIVLVADKGYRHFVVIKGAADGRILVGDPSSGTRSMGRQAFESIWANKLLFVIHGSPSSPQFNLATDWRAAPRAPLDTAIDRSSLGMVTMPKHGAGGF